MDFMVDADMLKTLSAMAEEGGEVGDAAREALMEILVALRDEAILQQNEEED